MKDQHLIAWIYPNERGAFETSGVEVGGLFSFGMGALNGEPTREAMERRLSRTYERAKITVKHTETAPSLREQAAARGNPYSGHNFSELVGELP